MEPFTIGKLARLSGVGVETVRFYERRGLIKQPAVKEGFRKYSEADAQRIRFIKRAQDLGFTLKEIKVLLELNADPRSTCADIKDQTEAKMKEVEEKIRDLKKMKKSLERLSVACGEGKKAIAHCEILNCFEPGWKCE
ncbi:MAG: MerR family DNA-binding protein [Nitrospirae bacterium]|nr:MerR family DNA-binding protein [Candidatus Manganitrophaceae bacterium]